VCACRDFTCSSHAGVCVCVRACGYVDTSRVWYYGWLSALSTGMYISMNTCFYSCLCVCVCVFMYVYVCLWILRHGVWYYGLLPAFSTNTYITLTKCLHITLSKCLHIHTHTYTHISGLGTLPLFLWNKPSGWWLGVSNAIAAGMMLSASFSLVTEGVKLKPDGASMWGYQVIYMCCVMCM
jgi:hypothetical protein